MNDRTACVAITKHGIAIARRIKEKFPDLVIYTPAKLSDSGSDVIWFSDQTTQLIADLFKTYDALICIFSLGAVIRMVGPHLVDKKSDPAVLVIDDMANYVVSALSGHLGGANALARLVASFLDAKPVITTAADVNETIAVDMVGREFGWTIENFDNITKISALMVNEEKIAIFQDTGEKNWWHAPTFPKNIVLINSIEDAKRADFKGALIISDVEIADPLIREKAVIYRPKSLVVGLGLHWDTSESAIESGIKKAFHENGLSFRSIRNLSSISKKATVKGLEEFSCVCKIPVETYEKETLSTIEVPNPSFIVKSFEGTASVAEASCLASSRGTLVVSKKKFPPDLTVAVSRIRFD